MDNFSRMKSGLLIAGFLASFISVNASMALDPTVFPGKGGRAVWDRARKLADEAREIAKINEDAAIPKFLQAIKIYPYSDCFYLDLGVSYESKEKPEVLKAVAAYRNATRLDPKDWRNWNALAGNLGDQKRYKECREAAARALTCHPPVADSKKLQSNIAELDKVLMR